MKYAIYCRKSSESEDRQILSLESQVAELKKLATSIGIEIEKVYEESRSAKDPDHRPLFKELIEKIKADELDSIVCWDINRLSRNPVDSGLLQWLLQHEKIQEIVTPRKTYRKEDTGLLMSVELGSANQFILDLSKNVKRGLRTKAEKGWLPNGSKPGYMNDKYGDKGDKKILPDPNRFPIIRKAWDLMLTGRYTPPQVLDILNNEYKYRSHQKKKLGGQPMPRSQVYVMLKDPFYYGEFEFPLGSGVTYKGKHTPMVTKEEFDKVQAMLGNKHSTRPQTKTFRFGGVFNCQECGCKITAEEKTKYYKGTNRMAKYFYYHCTHKRNDYLCNQKSIEQSELEKQILKIIDSISIPESFASFAIDNLHRLSEEDQKIKRTVVNNSSDQRESLIGQQQKLLDLLLKGTISETEYQDKKKALQKEVDCLEITPTPTNWLEKSVEVFNIAKLARQRFETGSDNDKKDVILAIGSNLSIKDKNVLIELKKPYLAIKKVTDKILQEHSLRLEPDKKLDKAVLLGKIDPQNPTWLHVVEEVMTSWFLQK